MATPAGWATEAPAVNNTASFEIEDVTPAKVALEESAFQFGGAGIGSGGRDARIDKVALPANFRLLH